MMLKAAIFDMDGVIIDSEPIYNKLEQEMFNDLNIKIPKEKHDTFKGLRCEDMWAIVKSEHNLPHDLRQLESLNNEKIVQYFSSSETLNAIHGLKDLLQVLRENNIKTAVASSSPKTIIELIVVKCRLSDYFDVLVSGEEVNKGKPEPDVFLYAADLLKTPAKNSIIIEDTHHGVTAGKLAGSKVIGYYNPNSGNQDLSKADLVISSFNELDYEKLNHLF